MIYRSHPIVLFPVGVLVALAMLLSYWLIMTKESLAFIPSEMLILLGLMLLGLSLVILAMTLGSYYSSYLLTSPEKVVITRVRLPFSRRETTLRYEDISEMTSKKDSPIDHIFDIGDLMIRSSGAADSHIRYLPAVDTVAQEIQEKRI